VERTVATADELRALAAALGRVVGPGDVIGLIGELGAGKTTFVQGLAAGLGVGGVTSPTFTLIHIHEGGRLVLYHADLYRLEHEAELEDVGLDDIYRQDGVCAVEWWDRFPAEQPDEHLEVHIEAVDGGRRVTGTARGVSAAALLTRWSAELGA
jgi:tRNA threonylcarbamoyladenosine biosynthesis protein TsaE